MWKVVLGLEVTDSRVLDHSNPYSHYNPDNPRASKECRGLLFHGLEENAQDEVGQFRARRNIPWQEFDAFVQVEDDDQQFA